MLQQLVATYLALGDSIRARLGEHSSILRPLLLCQQNLNAIARCHPPPPAPPLHLPLMHSLSLAVQSLRDTIAINNACLLQLLSHPTPPPPSSVPSDDPVLRALGGGRLLGELQAAQRAVRDAVAAAAVP